MHGLQSFWVASQEFRVLLDLLYFRSRVRGWLGMGAQDLGGHVYGGDVEGYW